MNPDGLSNVMQALRYWERRQEAVTHNLANVSTPGFKGEHVFARLLNDAKVVAESRTDFREGALSTTGRPLDLALEGDGFLVVETSSGERYIRGGSLSVDPSGRLVDQGGNPVQGHSGAIILPEGDLAVGPSGKITVNGEYIGTLRIDGIPKGASMAREEGRLFVPPEDPVGVEEGQVQIHQGRLEDSNVDPVTSMVEMIEIQRAYSAIQKSAQVMDAVMGTVANDLGKIG
jgi:flagellar basal body rod protein FlgG